ncbi:MAG: DUF484 family protein [Gammaproteobacteria bacterium]|nr:DUF484 family protein [Gammaproteobacteria bacterium]
MSDTPRITPLSDNNESQIRDFLESHPDYLIENPELLARLNIPHETGGAASLIERQVGLLRDKNRRLQQQLGEMLENATANEKLLGQIRSLAEQLGRDETDHSIINTEALMTTTFNADWSRLLLDCSDLSPAARAALDECRQLAKDGPASGANLPENTLQLIHPESKAANLSLALIPLGKSGKRGVAIIASSQAQRFEANHDTLFLNLLGTVLTLAYSHRA